MKREKSIKLTLIRMLSDPEIILTELEVSNDIKTIPPKTFGDYQKRKLTGVSHYYITIYKEPKKK